MEKSLFVYLSVLMFAMFLSSCESQKGSCPLTGEKGQEKVSPAQKDIVDTAVGAGSFKTLATALAAADLVDTLKGKGPFTVFAPTDAAFAKLPPGTLDSLLKPENKGKLQNILTYHVVKGSLHAEKVVKMHSLKALNGKKLKIHTMDGKVMVNNADITATNVQASNGVIHVIDAVLLP